MNPSAWIAAAAIVILGLGLIALTFSSRFSADRAESFARSVGLELPPPLRAAVTARIARRHRAGSVGMILGTAAAAFLLATDTRSSENFASPFLLFAGSFVGLAIGVAISSVTSSRTTDPDAVKYARTAAVALDDYVAPLERTGARIVVALAVAAVIAAYATGVVANPVLAALGGLAVASLVLFEVAGRRLVERSQPATSPAELAWDDAVRASQLRDIVTAPLTLGSFSLVIGLGAIVDRLSDSYGFTAIAVTGFGAIALVVASIVSRPQRYFLRRLWPAVEA